MNAASVGYAPAAAGRSTNMSSRFSTPLGPEHLQPGANRKANASQAGRATAFGASGRTYQSASKHYSQSQHRNMANEPDATDLNRTRESGTNVSYQSNYSAIKSNILRFKNRKPAAGAKVTLKQGAAAGIKVPIPVQRAGATTPAQADDKPTNNLREHGASSAMGIINTHRAPYTRGALPLRQDIYHTAKKQNINSMVEGSPSPAPKTGKFLKTVYIELGNQEDALAKQTGRIQEGPKGAKEDVNDGEAADSLKSRNAGVNQVLT